VNLAVEYTATVAAALGVNRLFTGIGVAIDKCPEVHRAFLSKKEPGSLALVVQGGED